jgi:hypothetical protein
MMDKRTFKTSKGFRTVFGKVKPNFQKNKSDVFDVPRVNMAYSQANPWVSEHLGCHRTQVDEFQKDIDHIPGAYYTPDGKVVCESRQARNEVMKVRGVRDNDAGYGDWGGEHN